MSHRHMDELDRWLAAEQAGGLDEADALFAAVASRHLPMLHEPAGLSAAILASLPRRRTSGWFAARPGSGSLALGAGDGGGLGGGAWRRARDAVARPADRLLDVVGGSAGPADARRMGRGGGGD